MAEFRDPSASVLLHNRVIYARTDTAMAHFEALGARLRALQQPEARPEMVRTALENLQRTGWDALLPLLEVQDFAELHRQCYAFDQRLREFLREHSVGLNDFADVDDLHAHLRSTR